MKKVVIAAVDELFFAAKIRGTAAQLGVVVKFPKSLDELTEEAWKGETAAVILDLEAHRLDPFMAAEKLKADERTRALPLIGFYAHVRTDLHERAKQVGIDQILPRSAFNQRLLELLGGVEQNTLEKEENDSARGVN